MMYRRILVRLLATELMVTLLVVSSAAAPRNFRVEAGSTVGFDASSTLHSFSGSTDAVSGSVRWDPDAPSGATGKVAIEVMQLRTGNGKRDRDMRLAALGAKEWPHIRMTMSGFEVDEQGAEAGKLAGKILGTLFMHGQEQEIAVPASVETAGPGSLRVRGKVRIDMREWGIEPPVNRIVFVTLRVQPEVTVGFDLVLAANEEEADPLAAAAGGQAVEGSRIEHIRSLVDRIQSDRQGAAEVPVVADAGEPR